MVVRRRGGGRWHSRLPRRRTHAVRLGHACGRLAVLPQLTRDADLLHVLCVGGRLLLLLPCLRRRGVVHLLLLLVYHRRCATVIGRLASVDARSALHPGRLRLHRRLRRAKLGGK